MACWESYLETRARRAEGIPLKLVTGMEAMVRRLLKPPPRKDTLAAVGTATVTVAKDTGPPMAADTTNSALKDPAGVLDRWAALRLVWEPALLVACCLRMPLTTTTNKLMTRAIKTGKIMISTVATISAVAISESPEPK